MRNSGTSGGIQFALGWRPATALAARNVSDAHEGSCEPGDRRPPSAPDKLRCISMCYSHGHFRRVCRLQGRCISVWASIATSPWKMTLLASCSGTHTRQRKGEIRLKRSPLWTSAAIRARLACGESQQAIARLPETGPPKHAAPGIFHSNWQAQCMGLLHDGR